MNSINRFLINRTAILILFLVAAIFASLQSYFSGLKTFEDDGDLYTAYNNYIIFKQSFYHLLEGKDLYILHPAEHWDLYKYSPTFALLFGSLALLPDLMGLSLWNTLNAIVLLYSVYYLPNLTKRTKGLILVFVVIELLTSLQNEQSNGLIAGLLIFTFGFLERRNYWMASLCVVSSVFIKLFGVVALALYLLYPNKLKLTYTTACWVILLALLPLLVVSSDQLYFLYSSWAELLANDHSLSEGLSVVGWLNTWSGREFNKMHVSLVGVLVFCLPLLRIKAYGYFSFRILLLASVLVWVVIFNHKAESPTFILAVCGVAIWYFSQLPTTENLILLLMTFVFTVLATTDVFPRSVRNEWLQPYVVKAVPCILVWGKIIFDSLTKNGNDQTSISKTT
jgi:hypothetical protein